MFGLSVQKEGNGAGMELTQKEVQAVKFTKTRIGRNQFVPFTHVHKSVRRGKSYGGEANVSCPQFEESRQ